MYILRRAEQAAPCPPRRTPKLASVFLPSVPWDGLLARAAVRHVVNITSRALWADGMTGEPGCQAIARASIYISHPGWAGGGMMSSPRETEGLLGNAPTGIHV